MIHLQPIIIVQNTFKLHIKIISHDHSLQEHDTPNKTSTPDPDRSPEKHIAMFPTMGMGVSWDGTRVHDRPFVVEFTRDHNARLGMTLCLNEQNHLAVKNIESTGLIYADGRLR